MRRKRNQLSAERVQLLDEIGFDWTGDVFSWEQRFAQLCEFKRRFGNTRVHARWPENPKLGGWVVAQRCKRRRGKLCQEHKQKLTSIGFEWEVEGSPESWERLFNDLVKFKAVEGHLNVPATAEHATLCRWIKRQRRRYKLRRLPEDCLKRLNEVGFEWTPTQPSASSLWSDMLGRLSKHRQATGSVAFHRGDRAPPSLRRWCTEQRRLRIQGELTTQQIAQLDALDFRWNPRRGPDIPTDSLACRSREKSWENSFNKLLDYFKIHGNYNVPQNWTANRELGRWVLSQRSAKRQGSLSSEHERRLAAIGFNWHVRTSSWERMYEKMHAHMTSGAANKVSSRMPSTLRSWAVTQRLNRKRGTLDAMRIAKLSDIGFEWEPHRTRWESLFSQLVLFHEKHKHCRVPAAWPENPQLAHWVAVQRACRKAGKLAVSRIEALDQLGFTWRREISVSTGGSNLGLPRARSLDWPEMFNKLRKFRALNGHFAIPRRSREERRLVDWVVNQRILRRRRLLDPAHEKQLDEIGFDWNPSRNRWEEMFQQLVEFKREHGHTNVPQRSGKYTQLAHWVRNQRAAKRYKRPIIEERGKRLDKIGFVWRLNDPNSWESMFERLVEFKKVYGHCNVPQHWKKNKRLGKWVNTQRTAYKRSKMPAEKEKQLNEIGFAWRLAPTNKRLVPVGS